jgi:hypothetical protein
LSRTLIPGSLAISVVPAVGRPAAVHPVAHSGHGHDDPRLPESLAERGDGDPDGVGEGVGVLVPGPLEQLLRADDAALGAKTRRRVERTGKTPVSGALVTRRARSGT